jgi:hypothetical protein
LPGCTPHVFFGTAPFRGFKTLEMRNHLCSRWHHFSPVLEPTGQIGPHHAIKIVLGSPYCDGVGFAAAPLPTISLPTAYFGVDALLYSLAGR